MWVSPLSHSMKSARLTLRLVLPWLPEILSAFLPVVYGCDRGRNRTCMTYSHTVFCVTSYFEFSTFVTCSAIANRWMLPTLISPGASTYFATPARVCFSPCILSGYHRVVKCCWCRRRDSNPQAYPAGDFKSPVSTNSTTPA